MIFVLGGRQGLVTQAAGFSDLRAASSELDHEEEEEDLVSREREGCVSDGEIFDDGTATVRQRISGTFVGEQIRKRGGAALILVEELLMVAPNPADVYWAKGPCGDDKGHCPPDLLSPPPQPVSETCQKSKKRWKRLGGGGEVFERGASLINMMLSLNFFFLFMPGTRFFPHHPHWWGGGGGLFIPPSVVGEMEKERDFPTTEIGHYSLFFLV